jgi:hypothetical protein
MFIVQAALAQDAADSNGKASSEAAKGQPEPKDSSQLDLEPSAEPDKPPQPKLMEDATIKLRVEPILLDSVVDRVLEPAKIFVEAPGATMVDVFLVPVDAPYGGRAVGKGRLLGRDSTPRNGFIIDWVSTESHQYLKLFAVVHKNGEQSRSRTIDIAVSGDRFKVRSQADQDK